MRLTNLVGLRVAEIPGKNIRTFVDHQSLDAFDRDEEAERRAARSLLRRHRSVFLSEKKHPRF